jgi:microcystin-dependent protein
MHQNNEHPMGEQQGQAAVTLSNAHLPAHFHGFTFQPPCNRSAGTTADPAGNYPAATASSSYGGPANVNMGANTAGPAVVSTGDTGGGQPLSLMQPYLVLNYCIALQGIFPSRN